jgi:hypothetical protein
LRADSQTRLVIGHEILSMQIGRNRPPTKHYCRAASQARTVSDMAVVFLTNASSSALGTRMLFTILKAASAPLAVSL